MKGVIADCLCKLVEDNFGYDKWQTILEEAGFSKHSVFLPFQDINDAKIMKLIESSCKILEITPEQAFDTFGDYWVNKYAPDIYKVYFTNAKSAKDFILNMDNVHSKVARTTKGAKPPQFNFHWKNQNTLIMEYDSHRKLIDLLMALLKGVGNFFNEELVLEKISNRAISITFTNQPLAATQPSKDIGRKPRRHVAPAHATIVVKDRVLRAQRGDSTTKTGAWKATPVTPGFNPYPTDTQEQPAAKDAKPAKAATPRGAVPASGAKRAASSSRPRGAVPVPDNGKGVHTVGEDDLKQHMTDHLDKADPQADITSEIEVSAQLIKPKKSFWKFLWNWRH